MATYLDRILAAHRETASADRRSLEDLRDQAVAAGPGRGFAAALAGVEGLGVIAEVKRRSPSKGDLFAELDPAVVAGQYAAGGATCVSVLTDEEFFGGSAADLVAARAAIAIPVLRKDFTVGLADVLDTRIMGADCVLLIAAALDDHELRDLHAAATEVGLDALVEVHDEPEIERALAVGASLVGVNQRDLVTFEVDTARAERVAPLMPAGVVRVAESGVTGPADAQRLLDAGYHAVLVGESLVTSGDPSTATAALPHAPAPPPPPADRAACPSPEPMNRSRPVVPYDRDVFVKICGITSEEDALLAVAMGADAVGFIFAPSKRQISPVVARDIAKRLPPEILTVGVFRDEAPKRVVEIINSAGLRAAQLHGHESATTSQWIKERVPYVIQGFTAGDPNLTRVDEYGADFVLVDSQHPGSGERFDWSLAQDLPEGHRIIMAGGLNPANVAAAIEQVGPWGVDVATGVERAGGDPGEKDARKVKAFVDAARGAVPAGQRTADSAPYDWMEDDLL